MSATHEDHFDEIQSRKVPSITLEAINKSTNGSENNYSVSYAGPHAKNSVRHGTLAKEAKTVLRASIISETWKV